MSGKLFAFCLLVPSFSLCYAQSSDSRYRHYTTADGLPVATPLFILQDMKGYIWFTSGAGVTKFDGYYFKNFTQQDRLPDNEILKLFEDSKGRIWLKAMKPEISFIYNDSIYLFNPGQQLDGLILSNIYEDASGCLWFCFFNGGIYRYLDEKLEKYEAEGVPEMCTGFYQDRKGRFLVGTKYYWGTIEDEKTRLIKLPASVIQAGPFTEYFIPLSGDAVLKTGSHLLQVGDTTLSVLFPAQAAPENLFINTVTGNRNGELFVSTNRGGFQLSPDTHSYTVKEKFLEGKSINMIIEDTEENLWFTTRGDGVYFLSRNARSLTNTGAEEGLQNNIIYCAAMMPSRELCLGSQNGLLQFVKGKNIRAINITADDRMANVNDLLVDRNNRLLCATDAGLHILNEDKISGYKANMVPVTVSTPITDKPLVFTIPESCNYFTIGSVKAIVPGKDDDFWLPTSLGLLHLSRDEQKKNYLLTKVSNPRCIDACVDSRGKVWWGNSSGLSHIQNDIASATDPVFLKGITITDLEIAPRDIIWAATNGFGIYVFKDSVLSVINSKQGLTSDIVNAITLDGDVLWAATARGLDKIELTPGEPFRYKIFHLGKSEGLLADEINEVVVDGDTVYVITNKGLSEFKASALQPNLTPPPVYISGVEIRGGDTSLLSFYKVDYSHNDISIRFGSLSFSNPEKTIYRYKMEGIDTDWRETANREVHYAFLPPNEYRFAVKAVSRDGIESIAPASVGFEILPPFWQTWWFRSAIILAVLLLAAFIIRYYRNRSILYRKIMEAEQKALRAQMNPHFVFNALYSIQHFITEGNQDAANTYLGKFSELIRMILEYSREMKISVSSEERFLRLYLDLESIRFEDKFEYMIDMDPAIDRENTYILSMIIQPFAENAIRHGLLLKKGGGTLTISLRRENGHILCLVDDDGVGRKKAMELKLRKKYQHESKGISITMERLGLKEEQDGQLEIIDKTDAEGNACGTLVKIRIPSFETHIAGV